MDYFHLTVLGISLSILVSLVIVALAFNAGRLTEREINVNKAEAQMLRGVNAELRAMMADSGFLAYQALMLKAQEAKTKK